MVPSSFQKPILEHFRPQARKWPRKPPECHLETWPRIWAKIASNANCLVFWCLQIAGIKSSRFGVLGALVHRRNCCRAQCGAACSGQKRLFESLQKPSAKLALKRVFGTLCGQTCASALLVCSVVTLRIPTQNPIRVVTLIAPSPKADQGCDPDRPDPEFHQGRGPDHAKPQSQSGSRP